MDNQTDTMRCISERQPREYIDSRNWTTNEAKNVDQSFSAHKS